MEDVAVRDVERLVRGGGSACRELLPQRGTVVVDTLRALDVDVIFGVPGGQTLAILDAVLDTEGVRFVTARLAERSALEMGEEFELRSAPAACALDRDVLIVAHGSIGSQKRRPWGDAEGLGQPAPGGDREDSLVGIGDEDAKALFQRLVEAAADK